MGDESLPLFLGHLEDRVHGVLRASDDRRESNTDWLTRGGEPAGSAPAVRLPELVADVRAMLESLREDLAPCQDGQ